MQPDAAIQHTTIELDRLELRKLSIEIECDERTLRRELLDPDSVKGLVGARIRRVLRARGLRG